MASFCKMRAVTPLPLATLTLPFGFGGQGNLDQASNCFSAGELVMSPLRCVCSGKLGALYN
jgi:hypothetical protein